ncbi:hypothetical protein AVEN_196492-1 [Araneus ventricosus]|uniref:Uncharacterized protein n=1 Tax=Araneus ventricosus TaxID=182803 RepID=A0A4Y2DSA3_ARAVE|nr:hypothetical protein AVEN_196492-1 [Araneus ventricosus]
MGNPYKITSVWSILRPMYLGNGRCNSWSAEARVLVTARPLPWEARTVTRRGQVQAITVLTGESRTRLLIWQLLIHELVVFPSGTTKWVKERTNRAVVEMSICFLMQFGLPSNLRGE